MSVALAYECASPLLVIKVVAQHQSAGDRDDRPRAYPHGVFVQYLKYVFW
jgi:hypothetical protein